jgi:hypothetical protein
MEQIFWAECPQCHGRFYCNHQDMRSSDVRLMCPFCRTGFLPEDAASLDERTEPADRPNDVGTPAATK